MICFLGNSHAPQILAEAARKKRLYVTNDPETASIVFISQDTPTDETGKRDLKPIRELVMTAYENTNAQLVLTSQVPPGFTRSLGIPSIIHMAETLRIKDAMQRALHPEQIIFGGSKTDKIKEYTDAFDCPVHWMSWEEAEFSKMAINRFLISQVEMTNSLAAAANRIGLDWGNIQKTLQHDRRIGPHAYLEPGQWAKSPHLLRDFATLETL